MISFRHSGNFNNTDDLLQRIKNRYYIHLLTPYAKRGVAALSAATPVLTGKTAASWKYEIVTGNGYIRINWFNTNENKGVNIAIILQYGHGTRNGGYVKGTDYINPAIKPIFDKISEDVWKEVIG